MRELGGPVGVPQLFLAIAFGPPPIDALVTDDRSTVLFAVSVTAALAVIAWVVCRMRRNARRINNGR